MRIVFNGDNAVAFGEGFNALLGREADIVILPKLETEADRRAYADADVIVSNRFDRTMPYPERLRMFHCYGAGLDQVDLAALPETAIVCNSFGHDQPIAEYVFGALLRHEIPFDAADATLRKGDWTYRSGPLEVTHGELADKTIGILGYGRIGKAIAQRAKAFEMRVHAANRSPISPSPLVDRAFRLDDLSAFWGSVDYAVAALPLTAETRGLIGAGAFAAMKPTAVLVNVGRGNTVDEAALYEALRSRRIAAAVIDTWYVYPSPANPNPHPATLPFHELPNVVMTPHNSAWTDGLIRRRRQAIAANIERMAAGEPCVNVVRPGSGSPS
jgi:phosphoglycerate dehydrogenase-like enzyme